MKDLTNKEDIGTRWDRESRQENVAHVLSGSFDIQGAMADNVTVNKVPARHESFTGPGEQARDEDPLSGLQPHHNRPNAHLRSNEVEGLAAKALRALASRRDGTEGTTPMAQLFALTEAYIDPNDNSRHDVLARIMNNGVSSDEVIEAIVPATARYMGQLWANDRLSFAEVTIGTARLQETVRSITSRRPKGHHDTADRPRVMLIVPRTEHHTLGVFVVAEQMRRVGVDVHLALGHHRHEILDTLRKGSFSMIGISASGRRTLASVRELVKTVRMGIPRIIPIVVGGTVDAPGVDIRSATGADHVTSDPMEALRLCGVPTRDQKLILES